MKSKKLSGPKNIIGKTVASLRQQQNTTQSALSAQLRRKGIEISASSLSALERQKRKVRDFEVAAIADVFGVSPDDLFPSGGC